MTPEMLANALPAAKNFLTTSPFGMLMVIGAVILILLLIVVPLIGKVRRKRIKRKETRDIMKDLFTWRHLSQLVKGGSDHNKAKQELSDNIARIDFLLKQGLLHAEKNIPRLSSIPRYVLIGEPRSGKSTFLAASDLALVPSEEENNNNEDPQKSLPVRLWTGASALVYDVSGVVFFDRWLEGSSAEWNHIVQHLCRVKRRTPLSGVIITIPADALLADDNNLSSRKAILMAAELGKLLQESGMRLPCYTVITKLDMISGFQEYAEAFTGDLRHQIMGFESTTDTFSEEPFKQFWETLCEQFRSGAKQLLFSAAKAQNTGSRMDKAGKIWLFPDNFANIYQNLKIYLEALFGEGNFHGTTDTVFEGVFFTSSRDIGFSFSQDIAALAGRNTDDVFIPVVMPEPEKRENNALLDMASGSSSVMPAYSAKSVINPYLEKTRVLRGYFIRDLLHKRIFPPSPRAEFQRKELIRRHIPQYALCAFMMFLGVSWLSSALFKADVLRISFIQIEYFYNWLDSLLKNESAFHASLIKENGDGSFMLDNSPIDGETLSSKLQLYYNALNYRDMKIELPAGFRASSALVFGFDKNMGYRQKAFIANQLHKSMVRIPVIKNTGSKLIEDINTQELDNDSRSVLTSFVSLDEVKGVDFYKFFASPQFKLIPMIRYLIPDLSDDTIELLNSYLPQYDRAGTLQMDVDYIYSGAYLRAKQAGFDTMLSAWKRRVVYPSSIYSKVRRLVSISEDITGNYQNISAALNRINNVVTLDEVTSAVSEWQNISGTFKDLTSEGRAVFEEVRLLMKAAHIPLAFDAVSLPSNSAKADKNDTSLLGIKKPAPDAFGNNLINDYLFNDMVINYAVNEYTKLFAADMDFIKNKIKNGESTILGQIIAEQNTFGSNLNGEVADLRKRAGVLRDSELLSHSIDEKPGSVSLFTVVERIILDASAIPVPQEKSLRDAGFKASWQNGQDTIKAAQDAFEAFVKPYTDNKSVSALIANARVMMLAESYYSRSMILSKSLSFLNTTAGNIAAVIESQVKDTDIFSFSGNAIGNLFGSFYYNHSYDPQTLKLILDNIALFASLINPGGDAKNMPLFLQNVDKRIYQPPAFMDYLSNYIAYWKSYPEQSYVSAGTWARFKARAAAYKPFQINSILLSIYVKSIEALNQISDVLLTADIAAVKKQNIAALGDRQNLLNQFQGSDAEKMFAAWNALPQDTFEAYKILSGVSEEELKTSYLAVYTATQNPAPSAAGGNAPAEAPKAIGIGWWNSFAIDGANLLSAEADAVNMAKLIENTERYRAFPLYTDAAGTVPALTLDTMREIADLFNVMGADLNGQNPSDPFTAALRHNIFRGYTVQKWAATVYHIANATANKQKAFSWTLYQPSEDIHSRLATKDKLLAINRFRYIELSCDGVPPRVNSTYMTEKLVLLEGSPDAAHLVFKFFKTSRDPAPSAVVSFNKPWSIFELYLSSEMLIDDKNNNYIPLYFSDEAGSYVYYVEIGFSQEIPKPSSWYSSQNWPGIMISNGMITEKR